MAKKQVAVEAVKEPEAKKETVTAVDSTGHLLHKSGRRLSEYEWPENQSES